MLTINLKPEHIERLNRIAEESGRGTDELIESAIEDFLEYDDWFSARVQEGLDSIEHGRLLTTEEVRARVDRRLKR